MNFFVTIFFIVASFLSSSGWAAESILFTAGVAAQSNVMSKIAEPFEKATGIKIVFMNKDKQGVGGDQVFKDVDSGVSEAGASGASWDSWLNLMKERGYQAQHLDEFKNRVIGRDRIQFMTYKKGGPSNLTEEQIIGILTGQFTNWKQVGGEDRGIVLIFSPKQPLTEKFIVDRVLKGKSVATENARRLAAETQISDMVHEVAVSPGAFGFGPINSVTAEVNIPAQPVIGRPITFIWRGQPSEKLNKLFNFIQTEGPKYGVAK